MTYTYSIHWHCTCIFTTFIFSTFFWARQQAQYIFNLGAGFWCQRLPHSADHTPIALGSVVRAPEHVAVWTLLTLAYLPTSKGCGAEYGSETLLDHEGECPDQKIALVHPQAWAGRLRVVRCDADATVWLMRCVCDAMCVCVSVCICLCSLRSDQANVHNLKELCKRYLFHMDSLTPSIQCIMSHVSIIYNSISL